MNYHWKDIENTKSEWEGLAVKVESTSPTTIKLQAGNNCRVKCSNNDIPLFWATISKDYQGVHLLKSFRNIPLDHMAIPPITSADFEARAQLDGTALYQSWCKYFFTKMSESKSTPLYTGLWFLTCLEETGSSVWNYKNSHNEKNGYYSSLYNAKASLDRPQFDYIDWGASGSFELIALKKKPHESEARVKWWRKKARNSTIPPILVWYVSSLDAFVIIDGHSRLLASILEDVAPRIISLFSGREIPRDTDEKRRDKIVHSLLNRKGNTALDIDKMNKVLIEAFDDSPLIQSVTRSEALWDFEKLWEREVSHEMSTLLLNDQIDEIIERI